MKQLKKSADFLTDYEQGDFEYFVHSEDENHSHPPVPGVETLVCVYRDCKKKALKEHFVPASKIIMEVLKEQQAMAGSHLPKESNLKRAVNFTRAKVRPRNPAKDPDFVIDTNYFSRVFEETFYIAEVKVEGARHLIFATKAQLTQLSRVKVIYCDGTFLLVTKPFMQLFTVNGMLTSSEGKL